jgi:uncharacterized iron-regulated protein
MRRLLWLTLALLAACHPAPAPLSPVAFALPDSTALVDGPTGEPVATADLLRRVGSADFVLLGEVHDNPVDMALRASLLRASGARHPAVVFEQFAASESPIAPPAAGESLTVWLDRNGFDRRGWRWPLHEPVVTAALAVGRSMWGSNMSRAQLTPIVMGGTSAAPAPLRQLIERVPLDSASRAALDSEIVEGHCGQLPATMVPGMIAAQEVRDAAMTRALLLASARGPAWLIAGNGHVRRDIAVPRILTRVAPGKRLLAVGLLEREEDGTTPKADERRSYDLVIITPRTARPDPCEQLRQPGAIR